MRALVELWAFLSTRRRYWIWPVLIFLVVLGTLFVLVQGAAIAPFIYSLF